MLKEEKMQNITFKQYRNIDLAILSVLLIISEAITTVATNTWFSAQPVAISSTLLFICIFMMRWNGFAAIAAVIGGTVFCIASGANLEQFIIYAVGNSLALLGLLWFKVYKKDEIRLGSFKLVLYTVSVYLLMQIGRWLISLAFGGGLWNIVGYIASDVISLLFAVVIMLLLRKTDGMIEDQKAYLFRLERERNEQQQVPTYNGFGDED